MRRSPGCLTKDEYKSLKPFSSLELESLLDCINKGFNVEMDGSMIPIVTTEAMSLEEEVVDRRITRQIEWQEARLVFARTPEQVYPVFGATLGSTNAAGEQLVASAIRAGVGQQTYVHGVGDGAPWITDQIAQRFGEAGRYVLDFYHLCDYLADASAVCAPENPKAWLEQQKRRLKHNFVAAVLKALRPYLEANSVPDQSAPVRSAHRYIDNRLDQLDYKGAIADELPVGSGEIESAHRYVIQQRLKRSGCWWKVEHAWAMLGLRVCVNARAAAKLRLAILLVKSGSKCCLIETATFNYTPSRR
jgi:hypothetical protein